MGSTLLYVATHTHAHTHMHTQTHIRTHHHHLRQKQLQETKHVPSEVIMNLASTPSLTCSSQFSLYSYSKTSEGTFAVGEESEWLFMGKSLQ